MDNPKTLCEVASRLNTSKCMLDATSKCGKCFCYVCINHIKTLKLTNPYHNCEVCTECYVYYMQKAERSAINHAKISTAPDTSSFSEPKDDPYITELERLKIRSEILTSYRKILDHQNPSAVFDRRCSVPNCKAVSVIGDCDLSPAYEEYLYCNYMIACEDCDTYYCDCHDKVLKQHDDIDPRYVVLCDSCYLARKVK